MITVKAGSVTFQNVRKTFGAFTAIHDLSLTIDPGTLVTLRLWQDHDAAHAGGAGTADFGQDPDRRQGCHHAAGQ